jgi:cytochrome c-type biogenesis protein CcmH
MKHQSSQSKASSLLAIPILALALSISAGNAKAADDARAIEDQLIAPCCWSQPVSEHDSEIAQQIRNEVAAMVAAGKGRDEILNYYVAKYGERILVTPRAKGFNTLVYLLPWAALPIGLWILFLLIKKLRSPAPAPAAPLPQPEPDSRYDSVIEKELRELDE